MASKFQIRRRRRQRIRAQRRAARQERRADRREARQLRRQTRVEGRQSEAAYAFRAERAGAIGDIAASAADVVGGLTGANQLSSIGSVFGEGEDETSLIAEPGEIAESEPLEIMGFPAWAVAIVAVIVLFVLVRLGKK